MHRVDDLSSRVLGTLQRLRVGIRYRTSMGTLATVIQGMKFDDGSIKVLLECTARARIARFTQTTDYLAAEVEPVVDTTSGSPDAVVALVRSAAAQFAQYVKRNKQISPEAGNIVGQIKDASELADLVASHLAIDIAHKQELLEITWSRNG